MADLVKLCLYISYFYGRLTGVLNFEIDLRTGKTRITKWATTYSACAQVFLFTFMTYHTYETRTMINMWAKTNSLHKSVFLIMAVFRILCVLLALIYRWSKRQRFIRLFNSFRRLFRNNPEVIQYCRKGILSKCFCATATELIQLAMSLILVQKYLTITLALGIWSVLTMSAITNVIITQYYFAIANIRGRYILLNKELEAILNEAQSLAPNRRGVFVTKCCSLADRLDEISHTQSELQDLTDRLSKTYELQLLCMAITYYLNSVGGFYIMFSLGKYKNLVEDWPKIVLFLGVAYFFFFYLDSWVTMFNSFHLLDVHAEMVKLMAQRTLLSPDLDNRLEATFESFELNLARNPFKLLEFLKLIAPHALLGLTRP
ncbi:putative gustatory receptor 59d [Drosophila takahashii]|uniref:putative gustatory receptor 59d n=1 Tax=Drosophila takahashii TaxID=29030 RepID=UPI001CF8E2B9|nr:putative gustatory receptor 59d [Drosophila takahashii]